MMGTCGVDRFVMADWARILLETEVDAIVERVSLKSNMEPDIPLNEQTINNVLDNAKDSFLSIFS